MKKNVFRRNGGFIVGCLLAAGASYFTADAVMTRDLASVLMSPEESELLQPGETEAMETIAPETEQDRVYETDPFTVTASGNIIKGAESGIPQQKQTEAGDPDAGAAEGLTETEDGGAGQAADSGAVAEGYGAADSGAVAEGYGADGSGIDGGSSDDYSGGGSSDSGYYDDGSSGGGYSGDGSSDGGYSGGGSSDSGYYDDGSSDGGYYDDGYSGQPIEIQDPGSGSYTYGDGNGGGMSSDNITVWTSEDVMIPGISSHYIDESELYNFDLGQLRLLRNEIFALHGRIFETQDLRDYFSRKSWYVPTYAPEEFDANMFYYLNDYEEANLNVILNYEAALGGN